MAHPPTYAGASNVKLLEESLVKVVDLVEVDAGERVLHANVRGEILVTCLIVKTVKHLMVSTESVDGGEQRDADTAGQLAGDEEVAEKSSELGVRQCGKQKIVVAGPYNVTGDLSAVDSGPEFYE